MSRLTLGFLDFETTGPDPETAHPVEIALAVASLSDPADQPPEVILDARCRPPVPIPPDATRIHGITDEDVADKPPFEAFVPRLVAGLARCDLLVGYGLDYDVAVLGHRVPADAFAHPPVLAEPGRTVDLLWAAKWWYRTLQSRELGPLCRALGIPHQAHRALDDALASLAFLRRLVDDRRCDPFDPVASLADPIAWARAEWDLWRWYFFDRGGGIQLGFGKYRNTRLADVDPTYLRNMLGWVDPPLPTAVRAEIEVELARRAAGTTAATTRDAAFKARG